MKHLTYIQKAFVSLFVLFVFGCSEPGGSTGGSGGSGQPGGGYTNNSSAKACNSYTPMTGAFDSANRHIYLGEFRLDKGSGPQGIYRSFLNDFGLFCSNGSNGFKWQYNQYTGRWEYAYHYISSSSGNNCSNWDDFFKLWIMFPRNNPNRAHLIVDASQSGYFGTNGQGYDVQRLSLPNAQIDCSITDRTVIYFEPSYGLQFRVNVYQGDKNSERLRAEVFYKNGSIGKSDFFIITN